MAERLLEGTVAHRQVGARADGLRSIELVRRLVMLAICGLAIILLVEFFSAGALALPW